MKRFSFFLEHDVVKRLRLIIGRKSVAQWIREQMEKAVKRKK